MRLSEFQATVEKALGDLLVGDIPYLGIIHGHGDGVLKKWLRKHIQSSKEFTIQDGSASDDGKTFIVLR
jgi:DNA mismatch repair protein MutS2